MNKTCTKCQEEKPTTMFYKQKHGKFGVRGYCKICSDKKQMEWREKNKKHLFEYGRKYREDNKNYFKQYRQWYMKDYYKKRVAIDPAYKLMKNYRSRLHNIFKGGFYKEKTTLELIGCSPKQLKEHLEQQFVKGMNWDNYGSEWHVDHILPCASFDLTDKTQREQCFHFSNLQPLWATDNLSKGCKING